MAYRFRLDEPFSKAIPRIAQEQIDKAIDCLEAEQQHPENVLRARKCLKRLRSLLALTKPALAGKIFKKENQRFRDIGRLLAGPRDAYVMLNTLENLQSRSKTHSNGHALPPLPLDQDVARITKQHLQLQFSEFEKNASQDILDQAIAKLQEAKPIYETLALNKTRFSLVANGLKEIYRQNQKHMAKAYNNADSEKFHDWRKTIQHHLRHMRLFTIIWPEFISARVRSCKQLADILGQHNDVDTLESFVKQLIAKNRLSTKPAALLTLCELEKKQCQIMAKPFGERLFSDAPHHFTRQINTFWDTASKIPAAPQSNPSMLAGQKDKPTSSL